MTGRRPVLTLDDPLSGDQSDAPTRLAQNPYEGAPSRQFNIRLLIPLHERYARLVRQLADAGFETSVTELAHALFHDGPRDPEAAKALIRHWRSARHGSAGGPA